MKQFNEQKTVCSMFPFYSLENEDIQNMVTQPAPVHFKQTNSKLENVKICNILQENEKLKSLNMELKDTLKTMNGNIVRANSEFEHKLTEKQNEIKNLKSECSNLQSKLHHEQTLRKKIETEYLEFKEMTFRSINKEREHYEHFTQRHSKEVSELKTEIKHLKSKLATAESNATTGATNISTTKQTGAHQGGGNNARTTSAESNPSRSTSHGDSSVPGCKPEDHWSCKRSPDILT